MGRKAKKLFTPTIKVSYGIQDCSKCEYKIRCEECVNNGRRSIKEIEHDAILRGVQKIHKRIAAKAYHRDESHRSPHNEWVVDLRDVVNVLEKVYMEENNGTKENSIN